MSDTIITAKCECGNKENISIFAHLNTIAKASQDRKNAALMGMGMGNCKKCGKEIWVYYTKRRIKTGA